MAADYLVCYIQGKRRALTWFDLDRLKAEHMADWEIRVERRMWARHRLYELIEGDTRDFFDMEEQWKDILDDDDREPSEELP